MDRQYQEVFRTVNLNHHDLKNNILALFPNTPHQQTCNYDQFLYIFDQQIHERCNRDVLHQLYTQAATHNRQPSLEDLVEKYIENLETSKICILRDEYQVRQLQLQSSSIKNRRKTFVFFKMIQASIYTRFTKEPTFEYRIIPTDLPSVTLVNALNPILNHEYTLEMEEESFDVIFYESGIEILRWTFPDKVDLEEGEYTRTVKSENVTFQAKIKYMPKEQNKAKTQLQCKIKEVQQHLSEQKQALHKLCIFKPFLQRSHLPAAHQVSNKGAWYSFTQGLFDFFPFMRQHVKTLFYFLILIILVECWASFFWSMEFLDIIACFYTLSFLLDPTIHDYSLRLLILQLTFLVLSIKSIWGAVEQPFFQNSQVNKTLIVVCIIMKILLIICLAVTLIRKDEIDYLKAGLLSSQDEDKGRKEKLEDSIGQK